MAVTTKPDPEAIIRFCEALIVPSGDLAGQPLRLADFQKDFIRAAFAQGVRLAILNVGRKNGKTAGVAAISLAALLGPARRRNGQIVVGALARKQAGVLHRYAREMAEATPALAGRWRNVESQKTIVGLDSGSTLVALSSEGSTAMGLSPHLVILDETGSIEAESDPFVDALLTSQGAYADALTIIISTAAATDNALLSRLIDDIRNNPQDKTRIAHVYEAPAGCELDDETAWHAANPALAAGFRSIEDIRAQAGVAQRIRAQEGAFRNLVLNQRVAASESFIGRSTWQECQIATGGAPLIEDGEAVWLGIDMSQSKDLTSIAVIARDDDGGFRCDSISWLPSQPDLRDRSKSDRVPYFTWHKDGLLRQVPGPIIDPAFMAGEIADLFQRFDVQAAGFDPRGTRYLRAEVERLGLDWDAYFTEVRQGIKTMAPATARLMQKIETKMFRHDGNPLLTMAISNAVPKMDSSGNITLEKRLARGRIDPIIAAIVGLSVCEDHDGVQRSYLETEPLFWV